MEDDRAPPPSVEIEDERIDLSDIHPGEYVVLFLFWTLAFVVFLQFFTRYVLNDSLGWTEEIARFLLIAVTFAGSVAAVAKGAHIAVELIHRWSSPRVSRALRFGVDLAALVFYVALAGLTVQLSGRTLQMMVSIDVPKAWIYWGVAACFALMALAQARVLLERLRGRAPLGERPAGPPSAD